LAALASAHAPEEQKALAQQLLDANLPRIEKDLRERLQYTRGIVGRLPGSPVADLAQAPDIRRAILDGEQKYLEIRCPILAIFALPEGSAAEEIKEHAQAMQAGAPGARVIFLSNASHYIFLSNEADVLLETTTFISSLH
jgi:pimeloyl-ACP methyl ester carboxylesterase